MTYSSSRNYHKSYAFYKNNKCYKVVFFPINSILKWLTLKHYLYILQNFLTIRHNTVGRCGDKPKRRQRILRPWVVVPAAPLLERKKRKHIKELYYGQILFTILSNYDLYIIFFSNYIHAIYSVCNTFLQYYIHTLFTYMLIKNKTPKHAKRVELVKNSL